MKSKTIKLTSTSYALLALLDRFGELTSYEIKDALETSVENFWPVPHTTAYQEPARLASGGYLSARQEKGGRRRRRYALTDVGREALREWADEPVAAPPQLRDELLLKIFAGASTQPHGTCARKRGRSAPASIIRGSSSSRSSVGTAEAWM